MSDGPGPQYVNVYVIPVAEHSKAAYTELATTFVEVARDHGALEVFENWEEDVPDGDLTDFRRAVQAQAGERVVVAWVVWPNRQAGADAHRRMTEDPRMASLSTPPFDGKRMVLGGFTPLVHYRRHSEG